MTKLLRIKSAQLLIKETYQSNRSMKRSLTMLQLIALGIGATIGSGIFSLTGTAAAGQALSERDWLSTPLLSILLGGYYGREGAGPAIAISFLIAAVACCFAALCYAELVTMIPVSGSAYTFAYATLGEFIAWIIGWDLILEYAVGNTAIAVSWSDHFIHFFHGITGWRLPLWLTTDTTTALTRIAMGTARPECAFYSSLELPHIYQHAFALNLPAFFIVALITGMLVIGVRESAIFNMIVVFIKIIVILFFIGYGATFVNPRNWIPFAPNGFVGIMGGAAIVFFSFIGFDAISSTIEEAKNPRRDMPIGIIGSLAICTVLYIAVSLVLTGILPYNRFINDAAPVVSALMTVGQPWAYMLVTTGALAGMTSVLLVFQLGQPRIFMAMARDGLLPKLFARLHPRYRTPFIPTILTGVFVGVTALFVDIGQVAELTNIGTLFAFIVVCAGVVILRKINPEQARPFRCPAVPLIPYFGIISCFSLMLSLPVITWLRFIAWMTIGIIIYFCYGYRKSLLETNL